MRVDAELDGVGRRGAERRGDRELPGERAARERHARRAAGQRDRRDLEHAVADERAERPAAQQRDRAARLRRVRRAGQVQRRGQEAAGRAGVREPIEHARPARPRARSCRRAAPVAPRARARPRPRARRATVASSRPPTSRVRRRPRRRSRRCPPCRPRTAGGRRRRGARCAAGTPRRSAGSGTPRRSSTRRRTRRAWRPSRTRSRARASPSSARDCTIEPCTSTSARSSVPLAVPASPHSFASVELVALDVQLLEVRHGAAEPDPRVARERAAERLGRQPRDVEDVAVLDAVRPRPCRGTARR